MHDASVFVSVNVDYSPIKCILCSGRVNCNVGCEYNVLFPPLFLHFFFPPQTNVCVYVEHPGGS